MFMFLAPSFLSFPVLVRVSRGPMRGPHSPIKTSPTQSIHTGNATAPWPRTDNAVVREPLPA